MEAHPPAKNAGRMGQPASKASTAKNAKKSTSLGLVATLVLTDKEGP